MSPLSLTKLPWGRSRDFGFWILDFEFPRNTRNWISQMQARVGRHRRSKDSSRSAIQNPKSKIQNGPASKSRTPEPRSMS